MHFCLSDAQTGASFPFRLTPRHLDRAPGRSIWGRHSRGQGLIRSFFQKFAGKERGPDLSGIEVDRTTYAVGDIHGRADLLEAMITRIGQDAGDTPFRVIFMGDYIDRGGQSRQVLERLAALPDQTGWEIHCLRGNHEVMLGEFLADPEAASPRWFRNGGLETLLSYEVGGIGPSSTGAAVIDVRDRLAEKLGPLTGWLDGLLPSYQAGSVFFAHAGADPAETVEYQSERTLYWGMPSMLETPREDGIWVVHGHYISDEPQLVPSRIAVDTGAYYSGRLTAARIATGTVEFLTA